jgi:hypothetical protein
MKEKDEGQEKFRECRPLTVAYRRCDPVTTLRSGI